MSPSRQWLTAHLPSAIGNGATRVLFALLDGHGGSYVALSRATGLSSKSTIHLHLHSLRDHGLITFDDEKMNTVRCLVRVIFLEDRAA